MVRLTRLPALLLLGALQNPAFGAEPPSYVIRHATVIPMTSDAMLTEHDVHIGDGRIVAVEPAGSIANPAGARTIDATGLFLVPGFTEMHGHLGSYPDPETERTLDLFLANGVTTVRSMLGHRSHLPLRNAIERGEILAPRLVASGPSFNGRSVTSPGQARQMVRRQAEQGYDFLKLHPGLTLAEFTALAAEAHARGIAFAGHVSLDVGLSAALDQRQATIDHLDGYMQAVVPAREDRDAGAEGFFGVGLAPEADPERIRAVAAATARAGVWNVPTQTLFENVLGSSSADELAARPEMRYMPAATVARWSERRRQAERDQSAELRGVAIEVRRKLIEALYQSGAGLLLGSDSPQIFNVPGFALHRELEILVTSGLPPHAALATGTVNVARFLDEDGGVVAAGARADLVLLEANPLEDIRNTRRVAGVFAGGRYLDRNEIGERLARHRRN